MSFFKKNRTLLILLIAAVIIPLIYFSLNSENKNVENIEKPIDNFSISGKIVGAGGIKLYVEHPRF